jgi:hypothetical protein
MQLRTRGMESSCRCLLLVTFYIFYCSINLFKTTQAADTSQSPTGAASDINKLIEGSSVNEWRGYYKREHSLIKPYQGRQ